MNKKTHLRVGNLLVDISHPSALFGHITKVDTQMDYKIIAIFWFGEIESQYSYHEDILHRCIDEQKICVYQ